MSQEKIKTYQFEAEVSQILELLTHSIYSQPEIFLRELVSNAADAIYKAKLKSLIDTNYLDNDINLEIQIDIDKDQKLIVITDNGIGMSESEVIENIGTIAKSGTKNFLENLKNNQDKSSQSNLIGQFGVGFYSVFMVAEKIELETKSKDSTQSVIWISQGKGSYELSSGTRRNRGTTIKIFLKPDYLEYADEFKIKSLILKYSNYLPIPIKMKEPIDEKDPTKIRSYQIINETQSIWTRSKNEIKPEDYTNFYKNLTYDYENPCDYIHINIEGVINYQALLYLPLKKPTMFGPQEEEWGPKLYVQNVLILEKAKELLPIWLRFVKGVIQTNDIPLNISRELLQNNLIINKIKSSVIKQILSKFEQIAKEDEAKYTEFFANYGRYIKEGIYYEADLKEQISQLCIFDSFKENKKIKLKDYIMNKKIEQQEIYFISGNSLSDLMSSPYLETFQENGIDVLLMSDPIDEYVVNILQTFEGLSFKSVQQADIKLPGKKTTDIKENEAKLEEHKDFIIFLKNTIGINKIEEIKFSNRMKDSLALLVSKDGHMSSHMEKIMQSMQQFTMPTKKNLELNQSHPLIHKMILLHQSNPQAEKLKDLGLFLYEQALINEGSKIEDMKGFISRVNKFALDSLFPDVK